MSAQEDLFSLCTSIMDISKLWDESAYPFLKSVRLLAATHLGLIEGNPEDLFEKIDSCVLNTKDRKMDVYVQPRAGLWYAVGEGKVRMSMPAKIHYGVVAMHHPHKLDIARTVFMFDPDEYIKLSEEYCSLPPFEELIKL